jgi:hypothetical protein
MAKSILDRSISYASYEYMEYDVIREFCMHSFSVSHPVSESNGALLPNLHVYVYAYNLRFAWCLNFLRVTISACSVSVRANVTKPKNIQFVWIFL